MIKKINLNKVFNGSNEQNVLLKDGDIIFVPQVKSQYYYQSISMIMATLSSLATTYSIIYYVNH